LLDEVEAITAEKKGTFLQLLPAILAVTAEKRLSEGQFTDAIALSSQAITMAGQQHPEVTIQSKYVYGLAKAFNGGQKDAQKSCDEALSAASNAGDFGLHSRALMAAAEAALARNDGQQALLLATQAQERAARGGQLASEWRGWTITALTRY
jgi:hypothetical protein